MPQFKFLLAVIAVIALVMVSLLSLAVRSRTRRFVFEDIRAVDETIEYLIRDMGFHAPTRSGSNLVFRGSIATFMTWGPVRIRGHVDGQSLILSGPAIFLRRLGQVLQAMDQRAAGIST